MKQSTWQGKPCVVSDGPFPIIGLLPEPSPREQLKLAVYLAAITGATAYGYGNVGEQHARAMNLAKLAVMAFHPEPDPCPATAPTPTPSPS